MKIQNKQDVINWLKRLREEHPLSTEKARLQNDITFSMKSELVTVYTDQIIKNRYTGMIDWLESEEVA